jgi:hypothetical protein
VGEEILSGLVEASFEEVICWGLSHHRHLIA